MSIPGIKLERDGKCTICSVENFSDELKAEIREQLSGVWNGFSEVQEMPEFYSYTRTVASFLDRYRSKSDSTKKGMIGELLSHILIGLYFKDLTSLSILKNKEERSIKKGFDIIYYDDSTNEVWYSEVKSGKSESGSDSSSVYNNTLLGRCKESITQMFEDRRESLWESALIDVGLTIENSQRRIDLKRVLSLDTPSFNPSSKKSVIFVSVLYHELSDPIELRSIVDFHLETVEEDTFSDVLILSIHKATFQKVADFLEAEANA